MELKIESILKSKNGKRIFFNVTNLGLVQVLNTILPILTIPYLVRVIGLDKVGVITLALATVAYFEQIVDFGFTLIGVKLLIENKSNNKISELFCSVFIIQTTLSIISFFILLILYFLIPIVKVEWYVYLFTFLGVISQAITPTWFYQGLDKLKSLTILTLFIKIISTIAIFYFIKLEENYIYVPIINFISSTIILFFSFIYAFWIVDISIEAPDFETIKSRFISGWSYFKSRIFVNFYTSLNYIILGAFSTNELIAKYGIIEKIFKGITLPFKPISQAIYPYLVEEYASNRVKFFTKLKDITVIFFILALFLFSVAHLLSNTFLNFFAHNNDSDLLSIYKLMSITIFLSPYGYIYTGVMLVLGQEGKLNKIILLSAILNVLIVIPSIYLFKTVGLAIIILVIQVFTILSIIKFIYNNYYVKKIS